MGGRAATVSALAVIVIAALAVALVVGGGDAPSDDAPEAPPRIQVSDLPEGLTVDQSTGRVLSEVTVTWHVYDEYHAFTIDGGRSQYTGTEVTTDALILDPGSYTITVGGEEFGAVVSGDIQRTVTWMYDAGSGPVEVGITYYIDFLGFRDAAEASRQWNEELSSDGRTFDRLPEEVVLDGLADQVESLLRSEFLSIGGAPSDRQGYADFLASFVQMCVEYPPTVTVGGERMGWDYAVYGADEYWAVPQETLYHLSGDCEDASSLLCALYEEAGYETAMGGKSGHVFAGVAIDDFRPVSDDRLDGLGVGYMTLTSHAAVGDDGGTVYYAVETIYDQVPVGYTLFVSFGTGTFWGETGFYPVSR